MYRALCPVHVLHVSVSIEIPIQLSPITTWFYTINRTACLDNNLNKLLNYSMEEQSQQDVGLEC